MLKPAVLDFYCVGILILLTASLCDGRCKFPREWKGRWYQGGLGEVVIRSNAITHKGTCVEIGKGGFYLVENRDENCYKCLLVMNPHENILQYKESYCMGKDSLDRICSQIRVETPLFTLVRESHYPSQCPFNDAYYFNYNDNFYDFCENSISYAKPCAGPSRFRFHFKHCVPMAYLNGKDLDFECIATWKDGSDMFLYGKFSGPSIMSLNDAYRCFKFQSYGSEVYMSMSADTTCRGLRSYSDGPLIMRFKKDQNGWAQAQCSFPEWMTSHSQWRDMDSRHLFDVEDQRVQISSRRRPDAREHLKYDVRCVETLQSIPEARYHKLISFTSHNCLSKYQCVVIQEIAPNLIMIRLGTLLEYEDAKKCRDKDFEDMYLLIPSSHEGTTCPFPGRHGVLYGTADCPGDLQSACNGTDVIRLKCSADENVISRIQCVTSWRQENTTYVIARDPRDPDGQAGCMSFKEKGENLEFTTECSHNMPNIFPRAMSLTILREPDECLPEPPPQVVRPVLSLDTSETGGSATKSAVEDNLFERRPDRGESSVSDFANNHEGQYQHVDQSDTSRKEGKARQGVPPEQTHDNERPPEESDNTYFEPSSSGTCLRITAPEIWLLIWTVLLHCTWNNR